MSKNELLFVVNKIRDKKEKTVTLQIIINQLKKFNNHMKINSKEKVSPLNSL